MGVACLSEPHAILNYRLILFSKISENSQLFFVLPNEWPFFLLLNPLTWTNLVSDFSLHPSLFILSLFCLQLLYSGSLLSRESWRKAPEVALRGLCLPRRQLLVLLCQQLQPHLSIPRIFWRGLTCISSTGSAQGQPKAQELITQRFLQAFTWAESTVHENHKCISSETQSYHSWY